MTLVLLHGLGGTGRVWDGVRALAPDALAPDLAGHGTAPRLRSYTYDAWAAELVERLQPTGPLRVIGHSLGGAVGLALASRGDLDVEVVVGLGIKTSWSSDDLAGMARVADKGVAWFDELDTALDRHLLTTGLRGVLDSGSDAARAGVISEDGRWRLAVDPEVHRVGAFDLGGTLGRVKTAVVLARGVDDAMSQRDELARYSVPVVEIAGAGHNAHVERPADVLALLERAAR
jgi:pimeloyl-ACP methyl ester carboxylesterase